MSNGLAFSRHSYKETKTMKANTKSIAYWITTCLVVFAMFSGGIAELARRPETIEGMKQLGYPVYFVMILGVWKLLGSVTLVIPGFPRVKEWAYAGIFFNMTGAAVSHLVSQDAAWHVVVTLGLAALAVASSALRPPRRALGRIRSMSDPFKIVWTARGTMGAGGNSDARSRFSGDEGARLAC